MVGGGLLGGCVCVWLRGDGVEGLGGLRVLVEACERRLREGGDQLGSRDRDRVRVRVRVRVRKHFGVVLGKNLGLKLGEFRMV